MGFCHLEACISLSLSQFMPQVRMFMRYSVRLQPENFSLTWLPQEVKLLSDSSSLLVLRSRWLTTLLRSNRLDFSSSVLLSLEATDASSSSPMCLSDWCSRRVMSVAWRCRHLCQPVWTRGSSLSVMLSLVAADAPHPHSYSCHMRPNSELGRVFLLRPVATHD